MQGEAHRGQGQGRFLGQAEDQGLAGQAPGGHQDGQRRRGSPARSPTRQHGSSERSRSSRLRLRLGAGRRPLGPVGANGHSDLPRRADPEASRPECRSAASRQLRNDTLTPACPAGARYLPPLALPRPRCAPASLRLPGAVSIIDEPTHRGPGPSTHRSGGPRLRPTSPTPVLAGQPDRGTGGNRADTSHPRGLRQLRPRTQAWARQDSNPRPPATARGSTAGPRPTPSHGAPPGTGRTLHRDAVAAGQAATLPRPTHGGPGRTRTCV